MVHNQIFLTCIILIVNVGECTSVSYDAESKYGLASFRRSQLFAKPSHTVLLFCTYSMAVEIDFLIPGISTCGTKWCQGVAHIVFCDISANCGATSIITEQYIYYE